MVSLKTLLLTLPALAAANTVTFVSKDDTDRTVYIHNDVFHPVVNGGSLKVAAGATEVLTFPDGWIGMWYAVADGLADPGKGMLGEVKFNGWEDKTYFDVSGIDAPEDHNGVYKMWGVGQESIYSGCDVFPCNNIYWLPDDVQTKVTTSKDLMCTLGGP
jgi:hypothetical protein